MYAPACSSASARPSRASASFRASSMSVAVARRWPAVRSSRKSRASSQSNTSRPSSSTSSPQADRPAGGRAQLRAQILQELVPPPEQRAQRSIRQVIGPARRRRRQLELSQPSQQVVPGLERVPHLIELAELVAELRLEVAQF